MFIPTLRIIPYASEAALFRAHPLGWIMHVQDGNGSPYHYFASLKKPHRAFSTYWISKTGYCEQYQYLNRESWCQGAGNPLYWSVEFEGYPNEKLTPQQIASGAQLHNLLRVSDAIANKPGVRGIGTHSMGGVPWTNHPLCPGTIRANQRLVILGAAQTLRHPHNPHPYPGLSRLGSAGPVVKEIQTRLNAYGYHLVIDGLFGVHTENAVRGFQGTHGLRADGIVGPLTWERLWR
jgi:hypothetical protein